MAEYLANELSSHCTDDNTKSGDLSSLAEANDTVGRCAGVRVHDAPLPHCEQRSLPNERHRGNE